MLGSTTQRLGTILKAVGRLFQGEDEGELLPAPSRTSVLGIRDRRRVFSKKGNRPKQGRHDKNAAIAILNIAG
jgi:hypothetical protein